MLGGLMTSLSIDGLTKVVRYVVQQFHRRKLVAMLIQTDYDSAALYVGIFAK
jgi:hypothetical protein